MMQEAISEREFAFTAADFEKVKGLIHRHAGIALSDSKQNMVYSRLGRRLRALKLQRFDDYLALIEDGKGDEWQSFVNSLTTNLTSFFREEHHFPVLAALLKSLTGRGEIRIWCSASSTGEEPYSIAITAREALGTNASRVKILATDIDTNVLETAQRGIYPEEGVARLDEKLVRNYFLRGGGDKGGLVRVKPEVQSLVSFRQINLLAEKWPLSQKYDAIFCRNVMIYFDRPTQRGVLEKFAPLLQPHGRLFIGHSESLGYARDLFELDGRTVYRAAKAAFPAQ
jgi:chemotaxis protein methyltransferase CheR